MAVRTIRDVLGEPESWPNTMPVGGDAVIVEVIASDDFDQLVIETRTNGGGTTYSAFELRAAELRRALVRVLQPGTTLRDAMPLQV